MTDRRRLLGGAAAGLAGMAASGCEKVATAPQVNTALDVGEAASRRVQRMILGRSALAPEFSPSDLSPDFKANGTTNPDSEDYQRMAAAGFVDWRLEVGGLVERPLKLSLPELRAMPSRTQITRHDCVEGWSSIGKWKGARLGPILKAAGLKPAAKFIAFFCADTLELTLDGTGDYYETIDLVDAFHEQTILAYDKNDAPLPIRNGAPLRLRVERQLGYKMPKYLMRIEAIESFAHLGQGRGGYWEDRGYQWYAGI